MAWTPLAARLDSLPLVLAGPILRRVDASSVTVWVALKESRTVTLNIYHKNDLKTPILTGQRNTVQLGAHLHIVAVTAPVLSSGNFLPGEKYYYNLDFGNDDTLMTSIGSSTITYKGDPLPSFSLPPDDLNKLRIIHGSCRKPHGESMDAMAAIDQMIAESGLNSDTRPHQLFLTGDQIYADDVANTLLFLIREASEPDLGGSADDSLFGWIEKLPGSPSSSDLVPGNRSRLVEESAKFTGHIKGKSDLAKSHLLKFCEYCVMYLFAWSDTLWPKKEDFPQAHHIYGSIVSPSLRRTVEKENASLKRFLETIPDIRRALANVPTFMIFDDHEVTDDWFLNRAWCNQVLEKSLGRRVLQNGLVAYALFQGWGNTPDRFETGKPGHLLLEAVQQLSGGSNSIRQEIAHLVGLPYDQAEATTFSKDLNDYKRLTHKPLDSDRKGPWNNSIDWHYTVSGPKHEVIVLDTRTWRGFSGRKNGFPSLLSNEALKVQLLTDVPPEQKKVLILVSAAPLIGYPALEAKQFRPNSPTKLFDRDAESWSLQKEAFERFLSTLAQRVHLSGQTQYRIIIFSGDVHSGSSATMHYQTRWPTTSTQPLPAKVQLLISQFTASSLKNETSWDNETFEATRNLHSLGVEPAATEVPDYETAGWLNRSNKFIKIGTSSELKLGGIFSISQEKKIRPNRLRVVTTRLNYSPLLVPEKSDSEFKLNGEYPHWRYRVQFIIADDEIRYEDGRFSVGKDNSERFDHLKKYLTNSHDGDSIESYTKKQGNGKEVVGVNNVGELTFEWSNEKNNEKYVALQSLWWRFSEVNNRQRLLPPFPLTRYRVDFDFKNFQDFSHATLTGVNNKELKR